MMKIENELKYENQQNENDENDQKCAKIGGV